MSSFAELFRSSKFVSLHPGQAIRTTNELRGMGNWGIKKSLPRGTSTRRLMFPAMTPTNGGLRLKIWRENFPLPKTAPTPPPINPLAHKSLPEKYRDAPPRFLGDLSEAEYTALLARAQTIAKKYPDNQVEWYKLLNVSPTPLAPIDANGTSTGFGVGGWYVGLDTLKDMSDSQKTGDGDALNPSSGKPVVVPEVPVYPKVKGRRLNRVHGGYAVGVSGYIAFCATRNYQIDQHGVNSRYYAAGENSNASASLSENLSDFWVLDARIDRDGIPEIHVSAKDPNVSTANFQHRIFGTGPPGRNSDSFSGEKSGGLFGSVFGTASSREKAADLSSAKEISRHRNISQIMDLLGKKKD